MEFKIRIRFNHQKINYMQKIAIIGTGISALSVAYHLPKLIPQASITFFEKSRRPGGRLSTRTSRSNLSYQFNHGAPYFKQ
jgi:predicted NAD/FAD-dependent oxidoreductase